MNAYRANGPITRRTAVGSLLALGAVGVGVSVNGGGFLATRLSEARRVARVGILLPGPPPPEYWQPFQQALRELGWIEGENLVLEWAAGNSDASQLPSLAADLVSRRVDVIVADGTPPILAARDAAGGTAIVMSPAADPVSNGLIESLARPGGNITGVSSGAEGTDPRIKRLEIFHGALPHLRSVIVVIDSSNPATAPGLANILAAAERLGVHVLVLDATTSEIDLDAAIAHAAPAGADGLMTSGGVLFRGALRIPLVRAAARARLPGMYFVREFVEVGGLMSFGLNLAPIYRRSAWYVDRLLRGSQPADLPVEQASVFEFVVNRSTAAMFDLNLPHHVAQQVTDWID